jgi:hypothetical protein
MRGGHPLQCLETTPRKRDLDAAAVKMIGHEPAEESSRAVDGDSHKTGSY